VNATEAAEKIGTDAKTLRRFIRSSKSTFKAVGSGARYEFDEKDIPTLRKKFVEWRETAKTSSRSTSHEVDNREVIKLPKFKDSDQPMAVSVLGRRMTRSERERRDAASRARVDRLEERLLASGKHISQYSNWGEKANV
jgi:hypothetical protein